MTREDRNLLLSDLCARLPYGVKILDVPANMVGDLFLVSTTDTVEYETNDDTGYQTLYNIKPYLRPMSSVSEMWGGLTEEEIKNPWVLFDSPVDALDYFLTNHIDFRGLIPAGLALEAPGDMIKKTSYDTRRSNKSSKAN